MPGDFMKKTIQGCLTLLVTTVIWGCAFVAQSVGMDHIGPFTFQAVRSLLAVLTLLPVIYLFDLKKKDNLTYIRRWHNRKLWKAGTLCGIALFIASGAQQVGLIDTDAGKAGFLTSMYIVIVPFIGLFFRKRMSPATVFGVIVAVAGLYLLSGAGATGIAPGDALMILCAFAFAVQIVLVERLGIDMDGLRLNCIQCLVCSVLSALVVVFTETPTWSSLADCALPLAYAGCLSMGVAYSLQIIGQQKLDAVPASIIMSLESVFAALAGWLLLHERMSQRELLGCGLLFTAVILSQIPSKRK
jgi:drug/metabolite transporter (DMT)-like permease